MPSISTEIIAQIHSICNENPAISSREVARKLKIDHTTVTKYRSSPDVSQIISPAEEHSLKRENQQLRQQIRELLDEKVKTDKLAEFSAKLAENPVKTPKWTEKPAKKDKDVAIPMIFASDWHLDEVVNLAQMSGMNEYNRVIADIRVGNFFDNTVRLAKYFVGGIEYKGAYLLLGGDIFSGNIHEELKITNETTIIESIIYWVEPITSGIKYLADYFGHIHIPCVVGNHGRLSHKPVAKNRVSDNFDYLFYNMLAMNLKDDPRITWDISPAADCLFKVHNETFLFTHGDQFKGGSGIAGAVHPWLLGNARKLRSYTGMGKSYRNLIMGHWHQLTLGIQGMFVNGSLKGFDEYAAISNFGFEPPQQALWLVQPRVGVTGRWPIHVLGDNEDYSV